MSEPWRKNFILKDSAIHGKGIFAAKNLCARALVGVAIKNPILISPKITEGFGRMINHSWSPNSGLMYDFKNKCWWVITHVDIPAGTEITLDYRQTPWYIAAPDPNWD